ncbi:hypothetical protein [Pseudomonas syringae]|uniref:hypothetical protein n=1 Tax=Pseudomonas syringae TaxID=317 RepID=UPI000B0F453B|nr:hypothetical protein [Pseudomonas syringae]
MSIRPVDTQAAQSPGPNPNPMESDDEARPDDDVRNAEDNEVEPDDPDIAGDDNSGAPS